MSWREELSPEARTAFDVWLDKVLHDLVKYLELMPRNIDWASLDEDDLATLFESIFETRADRRGTRSAQTLWHEALGALPGGLTLPVTNEVEAHIATLEAAREPLEAAADGVGDDAQLAALIETVDPPKLREAIFGIGTALRGLRG